MSIPSLNRAFFGMKADSGDDRVESFPVAAGGVPFGVVAGTDASGNLVPGPGTKVRGIAVHSHVGANATDGSGYAQYDCASVMARGLVWAKVTAAIAVTQDGPVSFAAAGTVGDTGATLLANAVFRSGLVTDTAGNRMALVELHAPFSETT